MSGIPGGVGLDPAALLFCCAAPERQVHWFAGRFGLLSSRSRLGRGDGGLAEPLAPGKPLRNRSLMISPAGAGRPVGGSRRKTRATFGTLVLGSMSTWVAAPNSLGMVGIRPPC